MTDLLLALLTLGCLVSLRARHYPARWKVNLWSWIYGLLALAAMLGAVVHGLILSRSMQNLLWHPIFLALGLVVALFIVAAIYDGYSLQAARRWLPSLIATGTLFYAVTLLWTNTFLVFILYEAVAMCIALRIYLRLVRQRSLAGAWLIALSILLNLVAAGLQASQSVQIHAIWTFDHNALFHLVQMISVLFLTWGLHTNLTAAPTIQ